jgi:hypothetical protein
MTENEELALLVGFKLNHDGKNYNVLDNFNKPVSYFDYWSTPERGPCMNGKPPDFSHDLNALDKWVVPVLRERGLYNITIMYLSKQPYAEVVMHFGSGGYFKSSVNSRADTLPAALSSAALKFLSMK